MVREFIPWSDMLPADDVMRAIKRHVLGPYRCGTLTHDNHDVALLSHPQGLDRWHDPRFEVSREDIIGDKYDPKGKVDNG